MIQPLIIEESKVREILTTEALISLMEQAMKLTASGQALQPPRTIHPFPGGKLFGFMPAYLGDEDYFGAKVVTAVPANEGTEYPSHLGSVMVFDSQHGVLRAMVDATSITELRTSAVSTLATKLLAREDAHCLAVIGSGAQARGHIRMILSIRDITEVRIHSRNTAHAQKLAEETKNAYGVDVTVCETVEETVRPADIICTVTANKTAYLKKEWIKEGAHINAVGAFSPTTREITGELVAASRLYADDVKAMKAECGEYLIPLSEGLITPDHICGSIGDILLGKIPARENDTDITLFDSLGLAVEDVLCAKYVYQQIEKQ